MKDEFTNGVRLAALLAGGLLASTSAWAGKTVSQGWRVPAQLDMEFSGAVCDNTGSTVEINGALATGGAKVKVIFRNNVKGTKELIKLGEVTFEIVPNNDMVSIPKQPVLGGVGGNPHISFKPFDVGTTENPTYVPLSSRQYLGRCVQDFRTSTQQTIELGGQLTAAISAIECSNKGSRLTVDLNAARGAVVGSLYFDNNYNRVVHETSVAAEANFSLTPAFLNERKGWGVGGAGGNPLIYLQFGDGEGEVFNALGDEIFVGRCNKLF